MKKLYVGNLAWGVTDNDLSTLFGEYGSIASAVVISDRETGRSRGFGFVEMEDGADQAIEALNGQDLQGRPLRVNEAQSKDRDRRGGGGWRWKPRWWSSLLGPNYPRWAREPENGFRGAKKVYKMYTFFCPQKKLTGGGLS